MSENTQSNDFIREVLSRLCCKASNRSKEDDGEWMEPIKRGKTSYSGAGKGSKYFDGTRENAVVETPADARPSAMHEELGQSNKANDSGKDAGSADGEELHLLFNSSDFNAEDDRVGRDTFQDWLSAIRESVGTMMLRSAFSEDLVLRMADEIRRRSDDSVKLKRRSTSSMISNLTDDHHFTEESKPRFVPRFIPKTKRYESENDSKASCDDDAEEVEPWGDGTTPKAASILEITDDEEKPKLESQFSDAAWC